MRFLIMTFFFIASAARAFAGQIVTLEEAESLFMQNSFEIKAARVALQKADAAVFEAAAWPNPVVKYSRESLSNGQKLVDETYSLSQNIDFFGRRSRKTEAARKNRVAQEYFVGRDISVLLVDMKRMYYRVLLLKENEQSLLKTARQFADTEAKMRERMQAGDVSGAELMKLTSERRKIERSVEAIRLEIGAEKSRLGLMLGITSGDYDVTGALQAGPAVIPVQEIIESVAVNSPELKGLSAAAESSEAALDAAERGRAPWIEIEGGYRKINDGFSGPIFAVSVPLPLFDRNRGDAARSRAELTEARFALEAGKKSLINEVTLLAEKIVSLQSRTADLSQQVAASRQLSAIAGLSYEEGESGLLVLLEAVRSEMDLVAEYHESLYDLRSTVLRLEVVSGLKFSSRGEIK